MLQVQFSSHTCHFPFDPSSFHATLINSLNFVASIAVDHCLHQFYGSELLFRLMHFECRLLHSGGCQFVSYSIYSILPVNVKHVDFFVSIFIQRARFQSLITVERIFRPKKREFVQSASATLPSSR